MIYSGSVKKGIESWHMARKIEEYQVVFIVDYLKPRIIKMGNSLRKKGYRIILFLNRKQKRKVDKEIYFCDRMCFFNEEDLEHLYIKCLWYRPLVYHIFCESNAPEWAVYLIERKNRIGKIIYDQYDVYRGFVTDRFDQNAKREKYCLERADGLCCRMFETQYLKQKFHYQFKKRILFFDYCWNTFHFMPAQRKDKIKFVYGGRLLSAATYNSGFMKLYKIERSGFKYITETVQNVDGKFTIIPTEEISNRGFAFFRELKREFSCLEIMQPMKFRDLIKYESEFDYGIDCVELKKDMDRSCSDKETFYVEREHRYYATNKYFDYLDAGIMPIYGRKREMFGRYLARYGGAVYCALEDMPSQMNRLKEDRKKNRKAAREACEIFSVDSHIKRLIAFYQEV